MNLRVKNYLICATNHSWIRIYLISFNMKGYAPPDNIAIRDNMDDDISDDVDDDVFIRDGKIGRYSEDKGLKRPLMAVPRRHKHSKPIMRQRKKCWKCCEPFCYGLAAITILLGD